MKYRHPNNKKVTWEDGSRGRPPKWVAELKSQEKNKKKPKKNKSKDPIAKVRKVLGKGTYRVNDRVIHVPSDCEFPICAGDTVATIKT